MGQAKHDEAPSPPTQGPFADHPQRHNTQCVPQASINYWCLMRGEPRQSPHFQLPDDMKVRLNGPGLHSTPSRLIVVKHHLCAHNMIATQHSWDETDPKIGALKLVLSTDFVWSPIKVWIYLSSIEKVQMLTFFSVSFFSSFSQWLSGTNAEQTDQKQLTFQPEYMECPEHRLSSLLILIVFLFLLPGDGMKSRFAQQSLGANATAAILSDAADCTPCHVSLCLSISAHRYWLCSCSTISHTITPQKGSDSTWFVRF